jgi:hypothetical protein
MYNPFKKHPLQPDANTIARWEKQYGEVCKHEANGKVMFLRIPTKKETAKIFSHMIKKNIAINADNYLKEVGKVALLGGDLSVMEMPEIKEKNRQLWQTL